MAKYVIEKRFSSFFKPRSKDKVSSLLSYAGIETSPEIWIGSRMLMLALFGIVGFLVPMTVFQYLDLKDFPILADTSLPARLVVGTGMAIAFMAIIGMLLYMHLYYLISERTHRVEKVLPDFLLMVSANLRSGMTPFAAFQAAARPEFGPLQTEILYISSRSLGSESFSDSIKQLTNNIDSSMLRRMVAFFENELKSGGKLAYLLETSAEEIRETEEVKTQMVLATKSYAVFLAFILIFGLPLLLGISTQFLGTFTKFQGHLEEGGGGKQSMVAGMSSPKLKVDVKFIDQMAFVIIVGTAFLTSVLIGVISEGKVLYGVKYFPPLAMASGVMFLICKTMIGGFIGSMVA